MEKACEYMTRQEFSDPKEIVKDTALDTHYTENEQQHSVLSGRLWNEAWYLFGLVVCNCNGRCFTRMLTRRSGQEGAFEKFHRIRSACHKKLAEGRRQRHSLRIGKGIMQKHGVEC